MARVRTIFIKWSLRALRSRCSNICLNGRRAISRKPLNLEASTATRYAKSCNCTGCLNNSTMIQQALLSVSNKTEIVEFARALAARGIALLSTGGTTQYLVRAGIPVTGIADYTGFPEILNGRIKTLHPKVHGALLARRDSDAHCRTLEEHGIGRI